PPGNKALGLPFSLRLRRIVQSNSRIPKPPASRIMHLTVQSVEVLDAWAFSVTNAKTGAVPRLLLFPDYRKNSERDVVSPPGISGAMRQWRGLHLSLLLPLSQNFAGVAGIGRH